MREREGNNAFTIPVTNIARGWIGVWKNGLFISMPLEGPKCIIRPIFATTWCIIRRARFKKSCSRSLVFEINKKELATVAEIIRPK